MFRQPTSVSAFIVGETDTVSLPFGLDTGETISSATASLSLEWGVDATPASSLSGSATISSEYVNQKIAPTTAGNIYVLTITATTSAGRVLKNRIMFETRA